MELGRIFTQLVTAMHLFSSVLSQCMRAGCFVRDIGEGMKLNGHSISDIDTGSIFNCGMFCLGKPGCVSWNFCKDERICQLNNETADNFPGDVGPRRGFWYFELKDADDSALIRNWEMKSIVHDSSEAHTERIMMESSVPAIDLAFGRPSSGTGTINTVTTLITGKVEEPPSTEAPFTITDDHMSSDSTVTPMLPSRVRTFPLTVLRESTLAGWTGWTVIQRRVDGSVSFNRTWQDYVEGFGDPNGNFWLGLENIASLCDHTQHCDLRFIMTDTSDTEGLISYGEFGLDESSSYTLLLGAVTEEGGGNPGDSMGNLAGTKFSTFDADSTYVDCPRGRAAGWWFQGFSCSQSSPNGVYYPPEDNLHGNGITWATWKGAAYSLKTMEVRVKPTTGEAITTKHTTERETTETVTAQSTIQTTEEAVMDGGGWTVIQRRVDGSVSFNRTWQDYAEGFGDPNGNFWLGLEKIASLCDHTQHCDLKFIMTDTSDTEGFISYGEFGLDKSSSYTLLLGAVTEEGGTNPGDSMGNLGGTKFSTFDADSTYVDCPKGRAAGWWFQGFSCSQSSPNGVYYPPEDNLHGNGITWATWKGAAYSLKTMEVRVKPTTGEATTTKHTAERETTETVTTQSTIQTTEEAVMDGGGWMVIQRRVDGSVSFNRTWQDYAEGFGDPNGNFWLGLENIASLCDHTQPCDLKFIMTDTDTTEGFISYGEFGLDKSSSYTLLLGAVTEEGGTNPGDSMANLAGSKFSTFDADSTYVDCPKGRAAGWWFQGFSCSQSSPNGVYYPPADNLHGNGITWATWKGAAYSLKTMEIRVKPASKETTTTRHTTERETTKTFTTQSTIQTTEEAVMDGGGWTVIQRRVDGSVSFNRTWQDYAEGFGDPNGNFWLGLENIASLCDHTQPCDLAFIMTDTDDTGGFISYGEFGLDQSSSYTLLLGAVTEEGGGNPGDSMINLAGSKFSTFDADSTYVDCPKGRAAGWWFQGFSCSQSSPNGVYYPPEDNLYGNGITWATWKGAAYSLKAMEIRVKV